MAEIIIDHVTKRFGALAAVDDIDMTFADGEVACLLGPSGCGKTTLMRILAGLETPTTGRVIFGGKDVTRLPPRKRNVGMVFQYPVMYPTLSVAENLHLPMRADRTISAAERQRRVDEVLDVLDMRPMARAFIEDLDIGSRQKVAIGRAVARQSEIVLFDEPTTNMGVNAKLQLIQAFKRVTRQLRQTIVYVTHDQTEAMTLADKIALMKAGKILQYDQPQVLYTQPSTAFGGWFMGNPGMNFVPATLREDGIHAAILATPLPLPPHLPQGEISIGVRPERVIMTEGPVPGSVAAVLVDQAVGIAGRYLTKARLGDVLIKVNTEGAPSVALGGAVHLSVPPERAILYVDGMRVAG
ncbi:MAG: ABC transporter ATP-binding protein [Paracoccaceae bacterium]|nr:ABC transporter ATP-binding protein [Paracoccaceae bacterium]